MKLVTDRSPIITNVAAIQTNTNCQCRKISRFLKRVIETEWRAEEMIWADQNGFASALWSTVSSAGSKMFGARIVRVHGASKIMAHLMFGVLALTVDQLLKLTGNNPAPLATHGA